MSINKITPCLWFSADDGKLENIVQYYQEVFGEHFKSKKIVPLGPSPSGYTEMSEVLIFDSKYSFMNTAIEHQPLNDSISMMISCEDQNEIDHYWNYFTKEGKEVQCGWCIDRYGLRWQIIPQHLGQLMAQSNGWEIMMKQKKIIIAEYIPTTKKQIYETRKNYSVSRSECTQKQSLGLLHSTRAHYTMEFRRCQLALSKRYQ